MKITHNFTVEELCSTGTGIVNTPDSTSLEKLFILAYFILQPIRDRFGRVKINSGYRSPAVNAKIKGSLTSQHMAGEAADLVPLDAEIKEVYAWCRDNLKYGQLIFEDKGGSQWIHISLPRVGKKNMMVGLFDGHEYLWTREGI